MSKNYKLFQRCIRPFKVLKVSMVQFMKKQ